MPLALASQRYGVELLSAELGATQAALRAHRSHLGEVRASVAELQMLVERAPVASPSESR